MSDEAQSIWRDQPVEEVAVDPYQLMNRRAGELHEGTRWEILMAVLAALLFAGVTGWRLGRYGGPVLQIGLAAVVVWAAISLVRFRRLVRGAVREGPGEIAAAGADYYRAELVRRRDHLRNAWVWHGPLVLALGVLAAVLARQAFPERLPGVVPLAILLAAWTVFGIGRRLRQARELQSEIEDLDRSRGL